MADLVPPRKRRRTCSSASLPTPPPALGLEAFRQDLSDRKADQHAKENDPIPPTALHVLQTSAAALAHITNLYTTSPTARSSLTDTVAAILAAQRRGSRLVVTGVGKSAFIAQKFVATCKSLSIRAAFLHACEAVHGDLGDVREGDVVMFVTYSGRTPELLNLLDVLPDEVNVVALSGQTRVEECRVLDGRGEGILLPAPVHELEEVSFGVAAPTTSTTVALAVTDMLALTLAEQMHGKRKREVFKKNHPGGAIGMRETKKMKKEVDVTVLELPSPSISGEDDR